MTKIAIISDTHFGCSNASIIFEEYQKEFFEKCFFPYCKENNITQILHLGDFFDNRKHLSIRTLRFVRENILEKIRENDMHMHIVPGNHCTFFKNTNTLSSANEILSFHTDCVTLHNDPVELTFGGLKIGMIPWIAADNSKSCLDFINSSSASILMGHFQISGFKLIANSNIKSEGLSKKSFDRYDMVLSGHFHTKSHQGNITYLGAQYQLNWSDVDDTKYFHVLDTVTRELEPRENPFRIYRKFYYDEDDIDNIRQYVNDGSFSHDQINKTYVRVIVKKKTNLYQFDQFIQYIKDQEPYDLSIIENYDDQRAEEEDDGEVIEDTSTLLSQHVDDHITTHLDKNKLKQKLNQLYCDASIEGTV